MDRRKLLKTLGAGGAAAITGTALGLPSNAPESTNTGDYKKSGFPAPGMGGVRDSIRELQLSDELVCTTQQPVYVLPRDHKFHAGQFYATNHFWEWHYFSAFCKDKEGNVYAMFFGTDPVGYDPKTGGFGFLPAVVSIAPLKEGKKSYYFGNFETFQPVRPADATSPADFQYNLSNAAGWTVDERYYANDERWVFRMKSANPQDPWCDIEMKVAAPGYIPRTPTGIEDEGINDTGAYNPQTMHGLSYYYIAPKMPFSGKIGYNGKSIEVTGNAGLEHQWGNIKGLDQENCRWRWFSLRFDDGRDLAFRHWIVPPDNSPVHNRNHFCMMHPNGTVEYGYPNKEMRFTPLRSFKVPAAEDVQWSPEGLMETPWGNFYLKSLMDDSVFISKTGMMFWEGPMSIHEGSSSGKQVGLAYCEEYFQPRGGPARMRTLPEQDLGRELPIGGIAPKSSLAKTLPAKTKKK